LITAIKRSIFNQVGKLKPQIPKISTSVWKELIVEERKTRLK
jgi:hypothetical protein